jgi:hypothetical protein
MLLGDRQVRHRQSTSKSAQVARGARLPRRNFATSPASDILANPAGRVEAEGEEMSAQDWTTFVVIFGVAALVMWRLDRLGKQIEAVRDQDGRQWSGASTSGRSSMFIWLCEIRVD